MKQETTKAAVMVGGILLAALLLFALKNIFASDSSNTLDIPNGDTPKTEKGQTTIKDGVQEVTLRLNPDDLNYAPNPIRVKAGIPVRITVDTTSVRGCTSSIVMSSFGIRKRALPGDNIIEFTPEKAGTYPFSCSMGMSKGMVIVE